MQRSATGMVGAGNLAAIGGLLRTLSASLHPDALLGMKGGSRQVSLPGQQASCSPSAQQQPQQRRLGASPLGPKHARACSAWDGRNATPKPEADL